MVVWHGYCWLVLHKWRVTCRRSWITSVVWRARGESCENLAAPLTVFIYYIGRNEVAYRDELHRDRETRIGIRTYTRKTRAYVRTYVHVRRLVSRSFVKIQHYSPPFPPVLAILCFQRAECEELVWHAWNVSLRIRTQYDLPSCLLFARRLPFPFITGRKIR